MDVTVRESGKWKGQRKLSKRGSGALRRCLFLAALGSLRTRTGSAFGAYYRALEARGLRGYRALVAVMRKMLVVAYHLLKSGERRRSGGALAPSHQAASGKAPWASQGAWSRPRGRPRAPSRVPRV